MFKGNAICVLICFGLFVFGCNSTENNNQTDGDLDSTEVIEAEDETDLEAEGEIGSENEIENEIEQNEFDLDSEEAETDILESEVEEEVNPYSVFGNLKDGKMYAAAGFVDITPTEDNHPCLMLLGGTSNNRQATGVHDNLEARVILLDKNGEYAVLVSLDLVGMLITDVDRVWDRLETSGISKENVVLSSTHTHSAPDSMGVWGEDYNVSGRCPAYMEFVVDSVVAKVEELKSEMVPVSMYVAKTEINEPDSNYPNLMKDSRRPYVTNDNFLVAQFKAEDESTVATVINWHCHPETMIGSKEYSADFPRWTRKKVEDELGGTCIYFSGTVGGLMTNLGVKIPERDEEGNPVTVDGVQSFVASDNEIKDRSLGYVVGEYALDALNNAELVEGDMLVDTRIVNLPFENLIFAMAFNMGVLEEYDETIKDDKEVCGFYGCIPQPITHISVGKFHIIALPGELFPEVSVGREASSYDWGEEWGVKEYPAITGYRDSLPEGHYLMEFGLSNNEIGYMIPESDFHPNDHPNYYEEYFSISKQTIGIVATTIKEMLQGE